MKPPRKAKAVERLQKAIDGIPALLNHSLGSPFFEKWYRDTDTTIRYTFGEESRSLGDFHEIDYRPQMSRRRPATDSDFRKAYVPGLTSATVLLRALLDEVQEYWEEKIVRELPVIRTVNADKRDVFILHGHDHGSKDTVARLVERIGLKPIILHEQANRGRTIIEKFEANADVAYAIALLTPDDIGAAKSEPRKKRDRPRQNVLFEFGYFIGRIGRERVCGLKKGDIEVPSDYKGVTNITYDNAGAWKTELIRELKAVGIEVDANRAV
jgi:hypothetical protein